MSVAFCALTVQAQDVYNAIVDGKFAPEFAAVAGDDDGVANNDANGQSIVTMKAGKATVTAVGGPTTANDRWGGQQITIGAAIDADKHIYKVASVEAWNKIKWDRKNQGDIDFWYITGTDNPYAEMNAVENSMGQKIYQAELDKSMFKAWDGWGAGANEVAEPEEVEGNAISCQHTTYTQVGAGTVVFGHDYVYYLWYADLTGTKTMTINATAGMQFRILMNRPAPEEGGDSHGGAITEINVTVAENGQAVVDLSSYEYVHLNAIKTGWGSPAGTITSIMLEGTVKPVTGFLDLISNGDVVVGKTTTVGINLTNTSTDLTAYQFDLTLPAGITLAANDKGKYLVTKSDRYEDNGQTLSVSLLEGNTYRFISFSLSNGKSREQAVPS